MKSFNIANKNNHLSSLAFLDPKGSSPVQRFETVKYRQFEKLTDKQLGFFWRPEEVDLVRDAKDFKELTAHEQHIFTSNLKRQILLDSVQGRSPNLAFLPLSTIPELETWIQTWSWNETVHSRSYTHIIRNIYSDPGRVFDELTDVEEIVQCADQISCHYDGLIEASQWYDLLGYGIHEVNGDKVDVQPYELKRRLWMALHSANALEGIRFYVSFACSWAFAELKKMEGNAKIIKLICRDENVHLAGTQMLIKLLPQDDIMFQQIAHDSRRECLDMFAAAIEQEKEWARYLFRDGSMIGVNEQLLCSYIDWIAAKRMTAIGLAPVTRSPGSNPLPWTQKWIAGAEVQVAPQQVQLSSYIIGGTRQDVTENTFRGLSL
jgi:ribonucleoside-diphosphate reductase beta chain